jgi:hypothetical protein
MPAAARVVNRTPGKLKGVLRQASTLSRPVLETDACYVIVDTDTGEAGNCVRALLAATPMTVSTGSDWTHRYFGASMNIEIRHREG